MFTRRLTARELEEDPRVNVSYSNPSSSRYVSVSGLGEVVHDEAMKRKLWKPILKA
jgi:general stress protein 26